MLSGTFGVIISIAYPYLNLNLPNNIILFYVTLTLNTCIS